MNIKSTDFVLEVGSGNNPNPRSNILVDRYLYDNGQRAGGFRIIVDRPFVVADGYRLPFKDKTFDYVICSHILEHMDDPKKFIDEIVRVGKAGYIEVPSDISERVFGWNFHLWYCSFNGQTLTLRKKTEGERFGGFFHRLIVQQIWFRRFFEEYENTWYIKYEWKNQVRLLVDGHAPKKTYLKKLDVDAWELLQRARLDYAKDINFWMHWISRRIKKKLIKIYKKVMWRWRILYFPQGIIDALLPLLMCPSCRSGDLLPKNATIHCNSCHEIYLIKRVIPILLTLEERKKGL